MKELELTSNAALTDAVINYGLAFIGVNMYWQYIVKGLIILLAVVIDMRKYAKRK